MIAAISFIAYVIGMLLITLAKNVRRADLGCVLVTLAVLGAGVVGMAPYGVDRVPPLAVAVTLAIMATMTFVAIRQYHWYWGGGREAYRLRRLGVDPYRPLREEER